MAAKKMGKMMIRWKISLEGAHPGLRRFFSSTFWPCRRHVMCGRVTMGRSPWELWVNPEKI